MCHHKSIEFLYSSLVTGCQANVIQTEQNCSIDKLMHLFIFVCCNYVGTYFVLV